MTTSRQSPLHDGRAVPEGCHCSKCATRRVPTRSVRRHCPQNMIVATLLLSETTLTSVVAAAVNLPGRELTRQPDGS